MGQGGGASFEVFALAMYRVYLQPGAMPMGAGGPGGMMICSIGAVQCFSGWLRRCEAMPTGGSWWKTGAQRC